MRLPLLDGMQRDFEETGSLRPGTTVAMYAAYAGHVCLTAWGIRADHDSLPLPRRTAQVAGLALLGGGTVLCLAGMGRFTGAGEVSGTRRQELLTEGVYRWSRNPQYTGYVAATLGASLARRSRAGLAGTAALGVTFRAWLPREEQHLSRSFGAPYDTYVARSHRWLGPPR